MPASASRLRTPGNLAAAHTLPRLRAARFGAAGAAATISWLPRHPSRHTPPRVLRTTRIVGHEVAAGESLRSISGYAASGVLRRSALAGMSASRRFFREPNKRWLFSLLP